MTPADWLPEGEWAYATRFLDVPGGRMAYVDEGSGPTVVLVHGTPSCSTEWREVMKRLLPNHRVVAVDHLGFGASERPPDWRTYSFAWHRSNLRAFLQQVVPERFHLVVHDVGGPIALPLVAELSAQRIASVVIAQSWLWDMAFDPTFAKNKQRMGGALMRWLYLSWNFSPKMMVKLSWGKRRPLTSSLHREFIAQFPTRESRAALWGFVRALLDEGAAIDLELERFRSQSVPTTVVWGQSDRMVSGLHLARWQKELPGARFIESPEAGHFVQVEDPERVAEAILRGAA